MFLRGVQEFSSFRVGIYNANKSMSSRFSTKYKDDKSDPN